MYLGISAPWFLHLLFSCCATEVVCNRGRTNGGKPETWRQFGYGPCEESNKKAWHCQVVGWEGSLQNCIYMYSMYSSSSTSALENLQPFMTHPGTTARGERCRIPANVGGPGKCLTVLVVELIDLTVLYWRNIPEHRNMTEHDHMMGNDEFQLASLFAFIPHCSEAASMFGCQASGRDCPECGSQATGSVEESHCSSHLTIPLRCECVLMAVSGIWVSCDGHVVV